MDNQVIFGGQINMQNNMRTIHVGIFHLFQKTKKQQKKNMLGIETLYCCISPLRRYSCRKLDWAKIEK